MTALIAPLLSGCGTKVATSGADKWEKINDYSFTLELFQGKCGAQSHRAWSITVKNDKVTEAKPLNTPARKSQWPEGAPTLKQLYRDAQGVKKDGSYDIARIHYDNGPYGRCATSFYTLDRGKDGSEQCETYTNYQPLHKAD
jgi:hypothetical protein